MGNAHYIIYRNGQTIEAGYGMPDVCNEDDCTAAIDRGLGYLCGETPGGDQNGCGGYFCGDHLFYRSNLPLPSLCGSCSDAAAERARGETAVTSHGTR